MNKTTTTLSREEAAVLEVGHTTLTRPMAWALTLFFLVVIMLVPVADQCMDVFEGDQAPHLPVVAEIGRIAPEMDEVAETIQQQGLFHGLLEINAHIMSGLSRYETALKDRSAFANRLIPPMQQLLIGKFRSGNESVYCGRDGWLFYPPSLDSLTARGFLTPSQLALRAKSAASQQPDPLKAIVEFHDFLKSHSIDLIILPAPAKATVYPEQFSSRYDGTQWVRNESFSLFLEHLEKAGVWVVDPGPALIAAKKTASAPLYLKRDTHWSPEGIKVVVRELVAFLHQKTTLSERMPRGYQRTERSITHTGDIAAMLRYDNNSAYVQPETVVVQHVTDADENVWQSGTEAEILLLGDSFTNIFTLESMGWGDAAGLAPQLAAELQRPVDAIVRNDNGAFATRTQLIRELAQGKQRLQGKRIVIWEFTDRELVYGDWKLGLTADGQDFSVTEASSGDASDNHIARLEVRATLRTTCNVPTPEDIAPYTDNLTIFEYAIAEVLSGACEHPVLYVAHWGVRDSKRVSETVSAKTGQSYRLQLENLTDHPELEGINIADAVVKDFSIPILYEVSGLASPGTSDNKPRAPMALHKMLPAPRTGEKASSIFGAFSEKEIQERNQAIQRERENIARLVEAHHGWEQWFDEQQALKKIVAPLRMDKSSPYYLGRDDICIERGTDLPYCAETNLGVYNPPDNLFLEGCRSPVEVIVDLNRQLMERNIHLMVVPLPPRAEVNPEMLLPEGLPEYADWVHPARMRFMLHLLEADVETVDVLPILRALRKQGFSTSLKMESHYTPKAAEHIAKAIAERLKRYDLPYAEHKPTDLSTQDTIMDFTGVYVNRYKDQLGDISPEHLPARIVQSSSDTPIRQNMNSPILILGDSYVNVFAKQHADFVSQLSAEMNMSLSSLCSSGGGPKVPREIASLEPSVFMRKRVVIWLFVARYLTSEVRRMSEWKPHEIKF